MRSNKEFLSAIYEKADKGKARLASRKRRLTAATSLLLAVCILAGTAVYFKNVHDPDTDAPSGNSDSIYLDGVEVASLSVTQNLLDGLKPNKVEASDYSELTELFADTSDFAFGLLRETYGGESIFISPYSILSALAMTANGADGETRAEIESAVGLTVDEMNELISSYNYKCAREWYVSLGSANSFWMRNGRFNVNRDFLLDLDAYYDAEVFAAPFDDGTLDDINSWVSDNTDGMIPEVLSEIDPDTVAFIINTVLFEGKWKTPYEEKDNVTLTFTSSDGTETEGEFMCGSSALVELDCATGIRKQYLSSDLSFVALLPNEGFTVEDVIGSLDSSELVDAMEKGLETEHERYAVESIPKFKSETSLELTDALAKMGISSAFDRHSADFSRITDTIPLYVAEVLHKTAFEIDEGGTRAAAATVVRTNGSAATQKPEIIKLSFDRPFVYMIVNSCGFPVFIGVCDSIA